MRGTRRKVQLLLKQRGKIHTDFEKKFIKAEVVSYEDLQNAGSVFSVREKGLYRLEGKDYVVKDGDVCLFRCGQ